MKREMIFQVQDNPDSVCVQMKVHVVFDENDQFIGCYLSTKMHENYGGAFTIDQVSTAEALDIIKEAGEFEELISLCQTGNLVDELVVMEGLKHQALTIMLGNDLVGYKVIGKDYGFIKDISVEEFEKIKFKESV